MVNEVRQDLTLYFVTLLSSFDVVKNRIGAGGFPGWGFIRSGRLDESHSSLTILSGSRNFMLIYLNFRLRRTRAVSELTDRWSPWGGFVRPRSKHIILVFRTQNSVDWRIPNQYWRSLHAVVPITIRFHDDQIFDSSFPTKVCWYLSGAWLSMPVWECCLD